MRTLIIKVIVALGVLVWCTTPAQALEPVYWPVQVADSAGVDVALVRHLFLNQQVRAPLAIPAAGVAISWRRQQGIPSVWESGQLQLTATLTLRTAAGEQTFVAQTKTACRRVLAQTLCNTTALRSQSEIELLLQVQQWLAQHPLGTADFAPSANLWWRAG